MIEQGHIMEETDDREDSPFAGVIATYKEHARKVSERRAKKYPDVVGTVNEIRAVAFCLDTVTKLEAL